MNGRSSLPLHRLGTSESDDATKDAPGSGGVAGELDWSVHAEGSAEPIPDDGIELWRIDLDPMADDAVARLRTTLSADECARADRFRFARDRRSFVITRGALRCLLGGKLGVSPPVIRFHYGSAGKPSIAEPASGAGLHFNVSHSGNLALIALTRAGDIGIDVEPVRDLPDWEGIAELVFDAGEVALLRSFDEPMRVQAFFPAWTRKEAIAKARGTGLGGAELKGTFSVTTFSFSPNWIASIAVPRRIRFLTSRRWVGENTFTPLTNRDCAPFAPAAADSVVSL